MGNGFLARHLRPIADTHPEHLIFAAGVSLWKNSETDYERETSLVLENLRRCADTGRVFVFFSTASMSMYGAPGCRGVEDERVDPVTPYGVHKHSLERLIMDSGVRHLILRLCYVVGPGGPGNRLIPALMDQIATGSVTLYRSARRDLIHVGDWVSMLDKILAAGVEREVLNMATGQSVPIGLVIDHLEKRLGVSVERVVIDEGTAHWISTDKLRRLVPAVTEMDFGPDYYRTVLDRYLEAAGHRV
ncbi:NAD-dependent epimerase/dehydratase family protein [Nonomuraea antri]|uniref:NAD-dependent epimerase/dehydratase family protein n=1 Tax=Nonomuraea antri TaxID=2730852 RepID=UPI001C2BB2F1|nr:NAD-dependent epimerase/dehydratase family protein [Nonomuraea antri]